MKVRFKKLNKDAVTPRYSRENDAAMDLVAISKKRVVNSDRYDLEMDAKYIEYSTGLAFEIPENHVGLIFPRSSISNTDLTLANSVGVVDSNYRGEVTFRFRVTKNESQYQVGDRVGQLLIIPYPKVELQEVAELSDTERGSGSYGSSGR